MGKREILSAMDAITQGVYVIGAHWESTYNLMTAAWLSPVSVNPPIIMVAIAKNHYTVDLLKKSEKFSVSVLTKEQKSVALRCGTVSGRFKNKLETVDTEFSENGLPFIKCAAAYLTCEVRECYEMTDHILFFGEVVDGRAVSENTLVYRRREFF